MMFLKKEQKKLLSQLFKIWDIAFMIFNMFISGSAVYRMTRRHEGVEAQTVFAQYLDQHFPDERLKKIYPNMSYAD